MKYILTVASHSPVVIDLMTSQGLFKHTALETLGYQLQQILCTYLYAKTQWLRLHVVWRSLKSLKVFCVVTCGFVN